MKRVLLLLVSVLIGLVACSKSAVQPANTILIPEKKSARAAAGLTVRVDSIRDSRCPKGVLCVWAGAVDADLYVSANDPTGQTLHLGIGYTPRRDSATVAFDGTTYSVILRDVTPYPTVPPSDEVKQAVVEVKKL